MRLICVSWALSRRRPVKRGVGGRSARFPINTLFFRRYGCFLTADAAEGMGNQRRPAGEIAVDEARRALTGAEDNVTRRLLDADLDRITPPGPRPPRQDGPETKKMCLSDHLTTAIRGNSPDGCFYSTN